tara:strand:+ start:255 stop:1130 length:876 start_codon:yes stop_codon:yes gene_type:complete
VGKKDKKDKKDKKGKKGQKKPKKPKGPPMAESADKYVLYQKSVQAPEADLEFFDSTFQAEFKRKPKLLREDFCGTFAASVAWAKLRPDNRVWGVDLDPEPLAWGREHNLTQLSPEQAERLTLIQGDVRDPRDFKVDVIAAQNFSFCIFKVRDELRAYFKTCLEGLNDEGIMVLDIFGGPESIQPAEDETEHEEDGFSYIWDQKRYDAITNEIQCAIHFHFKDGSKLTDAFTYDWRLWTIAELRELLVEAGFKKADAYWEGTDDDDEGNGEFVKSASEENEDAWIAYVVGVK